MDILNEDFTKLYKRWKGGEVRKENKIDRSLIQEFIKKYHIDDSDITINETDVDFDCDISITDIKDLTFKIGKVYGSFDASSLNLKDGEMDFFPDTVSENFDISSNSLTSLKGCPKAVGGYFYAFDSDELKSLEYLPKYIGGNFTLTGTNFNENDIPSDVKISGDIKFTIRRRRI